VRVLVDSWAWLEYFQKTPRGVQAAKYLDDAAVEKITTKINVFEVYCKLLRENGEMAAKNAVGAMLELSTLDALDLSTIQMAAEIKKTFQAGMADAIVAATAMKENAKVLTGDDDFKKIRGIGLIFLE